MRRNVNQFIKIFSQTFPIQEPILEIGSFQVEGQEGIADLRSYFKNKEYIGADMREGKGVDTVEDVENLTFSDSSIGTVIIMDTLEHVKNCHRAMEEIHRVLKNDGIVVMSSVMDFKIHDYPNDYWRFTPESFRFLLDKFNRKIVGYEGRAEQPDYIYGIGIKNTKLDFHNQFTKLQDEYKNMAKRTFLARRARTISKCVVNIIKNIFGIDARTEFKYYE